MALRPKDLAMSTSHTVERKLVVAPYGLDTHTHARRVKVWLKGDNLGVLV